MSSKIWTKEEISAKLQTSDAWVVRAVIAIYERQTEDEQVSMTTNHHNSVGFNGVDAEIMSSFAQQAKRRGSLSPKQLVIARRKIMKYAGQLAAIANEANDHRAADEKWSKETAIMVQHDRTRMDPDGMLWA